MYINLYYILPTNTDTYLIQLIEMCVHIRDRWDYKKLLHTVTELSLMESSYIKYHTYLALTLHNTIQHKDADYRKSYISFSVIYIR